MENIAQHFEAIGASLIVHPPEIRRRDRRTPDPDSWFALDVDSDRRGRERFVLRHGPTAPPLLLQHLDRPARHLLLVSGDRRSRGRFLCGHDERHWFVAGIGEPVTTVTQAKLALVPAAIRDAVARERHRDRHHNQTFTRQGEWFMVPASLPGALDWRTQVLRNEPITRGGRSKPHICEELVRFGGQSVRLLGGLELTDSHFEKLDARRRGAVQLMTRNAAVYVRGRISHPDHASLFLRDWHRVFLNAEFSTSRVAFYD